MVAVRDHLLAGEPGYKPRPIEEPPIGLLRDTDRLLIRVARVAKGAKRRSRLLHRERLNPIPPDAVQLREGMPEMRRLQEVNILSGLDDRLDAEEVQPARRGSKRQPPHHAVTINIDPVQVDRIP